MKKLSEFLIKENTNQQDNKQKVFAVNFGDGTMYNFYYDKLEAEQVAKKLNAEVEDNNCKVVEMDKSEIEK